MSEIVGNVLQLSGDSEILKYQGSSATLHTNRVWFLLMHCGCNYSIE